MNLQKTILKLIFNTIIGAILLAIINYIGNYFNFFIGLNIYSALIVGILGLPGIILLTALKFMS